MMKLKSQMLLLCLGTTLLAFAAGCDRPAGADAGSTPAPSVSETLSSSSIAAYQSELLDIAFDAATLIPVDPHIQDRSRAQEAVVAACLELKQPQRALGYIRKIEDWRQGAAYADLAFYCAESGLAGQVQQYLDQAEHVAASAEDWRRDRIRVKIARTHALLGNAEKAAQFEAGVAASESGKVQAVDATLIDDSRFDEQIKVLDQIIEARNFDQTRNALEALAELFNRFYDNESRRSLTEGKIKGGWNKLPVMIRIDLMLELAGFALHHHDQKKALELAIGAQEMIESGRWMPEDQVSLMGRTARACALGGDTERARIQADAALALFNKEREKIVNIDRAGALLMVAEAYQSMGDAAAALGVYKLAAKEGVENPNSRPRAQDLSATCSSMAAHAVEPDTELWDRIHQIRGGLGEPW